MKPLLVTSGEPAGVGPDICLACASFDLPVVVVADKDVLKSRALQLGVEVEVCDYMDNQNITPEPGKIFVLSVPLSQKVIPGQLNVSHSPYVMHMLEEASKRVLRQEFSALVTAPVNKAILNEAGFVFSGHTEFLKEQCHVSEVVMLLASTLMRVALVTTHLPLKDVPLAITRYRLEKVITILYNSLQRDFGLAQPQILVAGLNPHAGESGYLGQEEIDVITPVIERFQSQGWNIEGPLPADTLFSMPASAFLTMYHDQGLPVIKYADFKHAVNVTLGLPIIRTSVDHGTALTLAGTGRADPSSLIAAMRLAKEIVLHREAYAQKN
jgi:4-hydroxythreonine-4-phosphate dehydrogenase